MESNCQTGGLLAFKRKELLTSSLVNDRNNSKSISSANTNECKANLLVFPPGKKSRQKFGRLESEGYVVYSVDKKTGCTPAFKTKSSEMLDKGDADTDTTNRNNDHSTNNNNESSEIEYNNNASADNANTNVKDLHNGKVKKQKHELHQRKKSAQSSSVISCAAVYDDQLFVIRGELLEGYSRKGNCFFYVKTPVTESVHTLVIDTPFIFIAGTFIVTVMQEINELGFYLCPDRILSFVALPRHAYGSGNNCVEQNTPRKKLLPPPELLEELEKSSTVPEEELFALPSRNKENRDANGTTQKVTTSGNDDDSIIKSESNKTKEKLSTDKNNSSLVDTRKWSDYLCCCGCVDRYIRVLRLNNMVCEFCCEAAVTALYVDVNRYRLYYGTQTGSVGVCEINENDSLRKMAVMHSSSSSASSLSSASSMAVTSICTFDVNSDGKEELIIGYENGSVSVYAMLLQQQQQQQQQRQVSRAEGKRENTENGNERANGSDRANAVKGQEIVDNNITFSSMTLVFVLLWRTTLSEKVIRVAAGNVTSGHKSQPDLLVQCASNKVYAFTLQEHINTNNERHTEYEFLQHKRLSKSKLGEESISKVHNEQEYEQLPITEEEKKEEFKYGEVQVDTQEEQEEQSHTNTREETSTNYIKNTSNTTTTTNNNSNMEKLPSPLKGQKVIETISAADNVENVNEVNFASEVAVPVPVPVGLPIPFATFISAGKRDDDDDDENKSNAQNEELAQIQEMEAFKVEEDRLRQELKQKRRIARSWDATQANIAQLKLEIEHCKQKLEAVCDESEYEGEDEVDVVSDNNNNNTDNGERADNQEERELQPWQKERREYSEKEEQSEICNVRLNTIWVKSESCLRWTFTNNLNTNIDDDDDDDGIAFIMITSMLPIKFIEPFARSNIRVITPSPTQQEHNVALIEVVKAHDKFANKDCDKEITIQLAVDEGYVPELAPHTTWHAAHAFYFIILRRSSRVALMRCVHVPALAMYTLTNNVLQSTRQAIEQKTENTSETKNNDNYVNDDECDKTTRCANRNVSTASCKKQCQTHTLSWLHYRGNFTEDDIHSWMTELFEDWVPVNINKQNVNDNVASVNDEKVNDGNGASSQCQFNYKYWNEQTNTVCLIELYTEVENLTDAEYKNKIYENCTLADEDIKDSNQTDSKNHNSRQLQKTTHFVCKSGSITCLFVIRRCLSTLLSAKFSNQSQLKYEESSAQLPMWGMTEHIYHTSAYEELIYRIKPRLQHCLQDEYNLGIVDAMYNLFDISSADECNEHAKMINSSQIQLASTLHEPNTYDLMRIYNEHSTNLLKCYSENNALETNDDDDDDQRMKREMLIIQDAVAKCKKFDVSKTLLPKAWQCILESYEKTQHLPEQMEIESDQLYLSPTNLTNLLSKRKNSCKRELELCISSVVYLYNSLRAFKYHVDALSAEKLTEVQQILYKCNDVTSNEVVKNVNGAADVNDSYDDDEFARILHIHFPHNEYVYEKIIKDDVLQIEN